MYAASVNADGVTDPAIGSAPFMITRSSAPPRADLAVSKTASTDTVHPGGQVTYTLVVRNRGPGQATGVTVQDRAPPGLSFQQAHPTQGQCTITSVLSCTLGTVDAGDAALVQVTATVAADATGTLVNQATVLGNEDDPDQSNNTATSAVQVTPGAQPVSDLQIQLHDPRVGQRHTFTITVTNHGPDPAGETVVTFTASLPLRITSARHGCTATLPVRCGLGTRRRVGA